MKLVQTIEALNTDDFTVAEGVRYQYKVRALKANGSVIQPGEYSRAVAVGYVLSRAWAWRPPWQAWSAKCAPS